MELTRGYAFHNSGSVFFFNPNAITLDLTSNSKRRMLEIQKDEARFRNSPDVYICDYNGRVVAL